MQAINQLQLIVLWLLLSELLIEICQNIRAKMNQNAAENQLKSFSDQNKVRQQKSVLSFNNF